MSDRAEDMRSPGNHPHADQANWQPADTFEAYLDNVREGLEEYSQKRALEILGWSRKDAWVARWMAEIPDELFDTLIELPHHPSGTELAYIGRALKGYKTAEVERCPHCGEVVRERTRFRRESARAVLDWLKSRGAS